MRKGCFLLLLGLLASMPLCAQQPAAPPQIEVVFVLDTTGSMSGMIQAAKDKIWSIARLIATTSPAPSLKMGLVAYRDRGDDYVTNITPLSADIDAVFKDLTALQAGGGGDAPESVNQALFDAVARMKWSPDPKTYRVVFLVGDCPPHMDYPDDVKYPKTCKQAAASGININTILCGGDSETRKIWQEIATLAHSETFIVDQSGGSVQTPPTSYDGMLLALSMDLDGTYIYYGAEKELAAGAQRKVNAQQIYSNTALEVLADRSSFLGTATPADTGVHDLVSDVQAGKVKVADVPAEQLPEFLRAMTVEEREAFVTRLIAVRKAVREDIAEYAAKRQRFLLAEMKKTGAAKTAFDFVIFIAVKDQAGRKGIVYQAE